jgi:hypothetical protein
MHIDSFGNLITNVPGEMLDKQGPLDKWSIAAGELTIGSIQQTYGRAGPGQSLALAGSTGFIEIAVSHGNAALELGLEVGTKVTFRLLNSTDTDG